MDITWHGNTCFIIKDKGVTLVINPDEKSGIQKSDIVLSSLKEGLIEVENTVKVFDCPGEYEIKNVPIMGFPAWTKSRTKEETEGKGEKTIIFCFEMGDIKICHLGELGHILTSDMVKEIGDVDILLINSGDNSNLDNKKATEVMESIDPRVVIVMGETPGESIKGLGAESEESLEKFTVASKKDLPEDKRQYVLLEKS